MTPLEASVFEAFRRACDERDLAVADRLLAVLELIDARRTVEAASRTVRQRSTKPTCLRRSRGRCTTGL